MAFLIRLLLSLLLLGAAGGVTAAANAPAGQNAQSQSNADARFVALSYHEVLADDAPLTPTAVRASDLAQQFAWLAANGWQPVSIEQILAARAGGQPLPDKAILLSFDDGKKDVFTRVFPLLRLFRYPAVIALVGEWLEVPAGGTVDYDGVAVPRSDFVSWAEVRAMQASGLVEVAVHTQALHRGIPANPQGNSQPAAVTRRFDDGHYETDPQYERRLRAEIGKLVERRTGRAPRVIVWPYGRSNGEARRIAASLGLTVGLSLEDGWNDAATPLSGLRRQLVEYSPSLAEFAQLLRALWLPDPARSVGIDPAGWPVPDEGLSRTLDRLQSLSPNIAFIRPAVQRDGSESVFFPTARRPLAADRLNHIAWQTERRAGVPVFIDLPEAWLDEPELVGDLARQVNFAGLRLAAAPGDPRVAAVRAAAERWRLPLRIAFAGSELPAAGVWTTLIAGDLLVLPARPELIAGLPDEARSKVLLEFDPATPAEDIARQMRQLEARGFRQFGLAQLPDPLSPALAEALSLRAQPQLR